MRFIWIAPDGVQATERGGVADAAVTELPDLLEILI
jgi:hypothetical protein